MPETRIEVLFVDTSALKAAGFKDPDFEKLLLRSKARTLRIVVCHIAWEEWRTSMRGSHCDDVRKLRSQFEKLSEMGLSHPALARLPRPALVIWDDADIDRAWTDSVAEYASANRIEIIPIGPDHGERVWRRYFHVKIELPFDERASRENRRKDLPDAWILEAAQDLRTAGHRCAALCGDGRLSGALEAIGMQVFKTPAAAVKELERLEVPPEAPVLQPVTADMTLNPLPSALGQALDPFRAYEEKVLGFVAYLGTPEKQQLLGLLEKSGISPEIATNVIDRLVLMKFLKDTGHRYLVVDRTLIAPAAAAVEADIIRLLAEGAP